MFCNQCGNQIEAQSPNCTYCGAQNRNIPPMTNYSNVPNTSDKKLVYPSSPAKNPLLMAFLSGCCITGLGQIILGQTVKGIVMLIVSAIFIFATAGFGALITVPLIGIDAYMIAKKLQEGKSVEEWEFF